MATKRQVFKGVNIQPFNIGGTSSGVVEQQEAQGYSNLTQNINSVLKFALGKVEEESEIRAYDYAAKNPLSIGQYLNADPEERDKLLPKGTNKFNSTLRNVQINFMATDMAMQASKDISALEMEATAYDMPSDQFEQRLNAIVNGYTNAFLEIDAEGAVTVKAKLATMAHSSLNSFLASNVKKTKEIKDAVVKDYAQTTINDVAKHVNGYQGGLDIVHDFDKGTKKISLDEHLKIIKEQKKNELLVKGYKNIDEWSVKYDAEVIKQKHNLLNNYYNTPDVQETATQALEIYNEVESGNFGGNKVYQEIYASLPNNEKEAFLEKVEEWAKEVRELKIAKEDARATDASGLIKDKRIAYYEAKNESNFIKAKNALNEMKDIDKGEYETLLKDFNTSKDDGTFTDPEAYNRLDVYLIQGVLTPQIIDEMYEKRKITQKQRSYFKLALDKRMTSTFREADAYIKKELGYEDTRITIGDSEEKSMAFERYRKKSNELYDYMINNPGISTGELILKAREIVAVDTEEKDYKVKIQTLTSKLNNDKKAYGGFTLINNEVLEFAKLSEKVSGVEKPIANRQEFAVKYLGSSESAARLITLLRSIQQIPEGGTKKVDVPGEWLDKKLKRPFNISDDNLDKLISDVKALKKLYEESGN